jgi:hypothetical protein
MKPYPILALLASLLLAGCSLVKAPLSETRTLKGEAEQQVLDYAEPKAENLIAGLIAGDYEQFSQDFDEGMKSGMDQAAFEQLLEMFAVKLGSYRSHEVSVVLQDEKFTTVAYKMIFEKDDAVVMRVVFDRQEPHRITGLWFDSPELRKP